MKKTIIFIILVFLFSNICLAQNKRYLSLKGFNWEADSSFYNTSTVNKDNTIIALSYLKQEQKGVKSVRIRQTNSAILLDLTSGQVIYSKNNASISFLNNEVFVCDLKYPEGWIKSLEFIKLLERTYYILNIQNNEKELISLPDEYNITGATHGYLQANSMMAVKYQNVTSLLFKKDSLSYKLIGEYEIQNPLITLDGQKVYGVRNHSYSSTIKIYNINNGKLTDTIKLSKMCIQVYLTRDNKVIYSHSGYEIKNNIGYKSTTIFIKTLNNENIFTINTEESALFNINDNEDEIIVATQQGKISLYSLLSGKLLATTSGILEKKNIRNKNAYSPIIVAIQKIQGGKFYLISYANGIVSLFSSKDRKIVADLFFDGEDWAVVAKDGRIDGTAGAFKKLEWREYDSNNNLIKTSSLDATVSNFFTPRLLYFLLNEEMPLENMLEEQLANTPTIKIIKPENNSKVSNQELIITVKATSNGDPIKEILIYINGKLFNTGERGFIKTESENTKTFTITLVQGKNIITARAVSKKNYESEADEITVFYEGVKKTANLHMFVIGIDKYKNPKYNLNYAVADATSFTEEIEKNSSEIFGTVNITFLKDADATKERILQEFENIKQQAKQEDVFIFYYAGHGVMSMDDKPEFHIIPYNVTKLYDYSEKLNANAISADELQTFSTELKAQKQMFVFDACQSGGMTEFLVARGAAEEKAIAQLARSTGTYWLTASNSEQYATEFAELGHGLFTYCVLLGLQGQADGGDKDKKITVKELSSFLDDKVPELSRKYKGTPQYPNTYGMGMDFPIIIVK